MSQDRYIQISLFKAIGILAASILTTGVTVAFTLLRTNIADHFRLDTLATDVGEIKDTQKTQNQVLQSFLVLQSQVSTLDKKTDVLDGKLDKINDRLNER